MRERHSVRVLLLSARKRLLLLKYRNIGPDGVEHPCWTTAGGGLEDGESIETAASREIVEETGIHDAQLGPIVWYGEDSQRSGDWQVLHKERFIVALTTTEIVDASGWTAHERREILETRWWSANEIRNSTETIYPFGLADLIDPVLAGHYPAEVLVLPRI